MNDETKKPTITTADQMPRSGIVESPNKYEKQKLNDTTSIPNSPIRQGETRQEENKSEGEFDTGLNEPVPQGEETENIGKL